MKIADPPARSREPDFQPALASRTPRDDSELAELIEQDGRWRLDRGLPCGLDRYRRAVPDLAARPISLDAAIDISLRSLARLDGSPAPTSHHTESLLKSYPDLAGPIRLAALLSNQVTSTEGLLSARQSRALLLPLSLGVEIADGRRRYELLRALGRGSSGIVCEAIDHLLSDTGHPAKVAVKLIPVDETTLQRQASEATKARRIDHPNVVRVLDRGLTEEHELFLVYELVSGGDLQAWFEQRGKTMPLRDAVSLVAQIASGVHAAHEVGLVHCDLKPSNVLMTPDGQSRVSDFGVAVAADRSATGVRIPVGNLAFAAPEQIRGSAAGVSAAVDVYALGGLLYYLATGRLPNGSTAQEVSQTHDPVSGRKVPPSLRSARPDADLRLDRICMRALRPDEQDRYTTAGELAVDLKAWLGARPIAWMRESIVSRSRLWTRRNPRVAILAAACVLLLVAGTSTSSALFHKARTAESQVSDREKILDSARSQILQKIWELDYMQKHNMPPPKAEIEDWIRHFDPKTPGPAVPLIKNRPVPPLSPQEPAK